MAFSAGIQDPEDLAIQFTVPGKYNPDALDDLKNRLMAAYREALEIRHDIFNREAITGDD